MSIHVSGVTLEIAFGDMGANGGVGTSSITIPVAATGGKTTSTSAGCCPATATSTGCDGGLNG